MVIKKVGLGTGLTGIISASVNAAMSITANSSTATFTADELILENVIGGTQYRLNNLNLAINLSTVGAGGMDTGSAPASGYVAAYVITGTGKTPALLGWNATSAKASEAYSGTNMPSGYTTSALVAVVPTNSLGQFIAGTHVRGRRVSRTPVTCLTTMSNPGGYTSIPLGTAVPPNAKAARGYMFCNSGSGTGSATFVVAEDVNGAGWAQAYAGTTGALGTDITFNFQLITTQTLFYTFTWSTSGASQAVLGISGYEF